MQEVALYNIEVTGPEHAIIVGNRACRAALGDRGLSHLTIAKDVQMKRSADKRSMRNPGTRTSSSWVPAISVPPGDQLDAAAGILNAGSRIAVLVGQGALPARDEVTRLADVLAAPVAKALLGKAVLPDGSPFTTNLPRCRARRRACPRCERQMSVGISPGTVRVSSICQTIQILATWRST